MAYQYEQAGTISITHGSKTVTGAGTSWLINYPGVSLNLDGLSYPIDRIDSPTSLTLVKTYPGVTATELPYTFVPTQVENYGLAKQVSYLLENNGVAIGQSAYDLAVEGGFVGSEQQWVESLRGEIGPEGRSWDLGPFANDPAATASIETAQLVDGLTYLNTTSGKRRERVAGAWRDVSADADISALAASTSATVASAARDIALIAQEETETNAALADIAATDLRTVFSRIGIETGGKEAARFRLGNRLLATMDAIAGFYPRKLTLPVTTKFDDGSGLFNRLVGEGAGDKLKGVAGAFMRWRIGSRIYATLDAASGFYPRKLTLPVTAKFEDGTGLYSRLVGDGAGDKVRSLASGAIRWRIGNRIYATLDTVWGFYPRKVTLPAATKLDDNLNVNLSTRLLKAAVGGFFGMLTAEAGGGVLRFRLGNRLLGHWTKAGGIAWTRQTLPADCKIADQPSVNLVNRLGGSGRQASSNANYVATALPLANGRIQITSRDRSTGRLIAITPSDAATSYRTPELTADNKVIFDSDADGRLMYAPADGGVIWPVDPYDIIDCWGDSLTAGAGSSGSGTGQGAYPKQLKDRMGAVVSAINNRGVGGQTSTQQAARHGGVPVLLTASGNQIAASGATTLTAWSTTPITTQSSASLAGTWGGVVGTLSVTSFDGAGVPLAMTFTRTTAGSAIAVSPSTPFIPDIGVQSRTRVQLITWGRNGPGQTGTLSALAGAVSYQTAYSKRFLVGTILASPTEGGNFDAQNAAIAAAYPNNWVDLNSAPTVDEMAIIGFVPDSYGAYSNGRTDAGDLALGRIPSGMRASAGTPSGTDYLHLNNLGYALWALRFYRAIQAKGWFPSLVAI